MRAYALLAALALTACAQPAVITRPVEVPVGRIVVQPIPAGLLQPHPIVEGPPSQCIAVAAARRAEIDSCNADKAALRGQQGQGDE